MRVVATKRGYGGRPPHTIEVGEEFDVPATRKVPVYGRDGKTPVRDKEGQQVYREEANTATWYRLADGKAPPKSVNAKDLPFQKDGGIPHQGKVVKVSGGGDPLGADTPLDVARAANAARDAEREAEAQAARQTGDAVKGEDLAG